MTSSLGLFAYFKNYSKQHLSSHAVYIFMFENGLDWKDAIFVIVPLNLKEKCKIYLQHLTGKVATFTANC